ncbi:hypothetical protein CKO45_29205 [Paracraurococcus ruber]|uniref:Uncharacterized protein n=1 Tax=Paracraurococcus ruber TaxID=77675 RepID=A0ABS1D888_9PROT|nr:hypothetical protein [Paracraurococcus ruber]
MIIPAAACMAAPAGLAPGRARAMHRGRRRDGLRARRLPRVARDPGLTPGRGRRAARRVRARAGG